MGLGLWLFPSLKVFGRFLRCRLSGLVSALCFFYGRCRSCIFFVSGLSRKGDFMDVATSLILRGFVAGCGCGCVALALMVAWSAFAKGVNSI